jgi:prepilin-type N-terminal cleavage/methylation domain-containing protein
METAVRPSAPGRQAGYTLLEMVVALTILSIGSAVLWYTLRSTARLEKLNRIHHQANLLARSDLEGLRSVPRGDIRDTSYRVPAPGGEELMVVREVFDSARIVSTLEEVPLDERMRPQELRKPLEVRVRVFRSAEGAEEGGIPDPLPDWSPGFDAEEDGPSRRTLADLILKIPEYRWH